MNITFNSNSLFPTPRNNTQGRSVRKESQGTQKMRARFFSPQCVPRDREAFKYPVRVRRNKQSCQGTLENNNTSYFSEDAAQSELFQPGKKQGGPQFKIKVNRNRYRG